MPELKKDDHISITIKDASGNVVRQFSSVIDTTFVTYAGGPSPEPVLPKAKGLNRFVWNLRYPTMPGATGVYIEASYRGHKAAPGKYTVVLKSGDRELSTSFEILPNPLYETDARNYQEYHTVMSKMETELTLMHNLVNSVHDKRQQLEQLLNSLPSEEKFKAIRTNGQALTQRMKQWDEDMVQRKAKAYDDVENFPNKFTAEYLFLINHTESDIPKVNKPSLDRLDELTKEWAGLHTRIREILEKDIPAINKQLWDAGVGAVWKN